MIQTVIENDWHIKLGRSGTLSGYTGSMPPDLPERGPYIVALFFSASYYIVFVDEAGNRLELPGLADIEGLAAHNHFSVYRRWFDRESLTWMKEI